MKSIKQYVLLVDGWRGVIQGKSFIEHNKSLYRRNTAGRYRVAAKTEKEAIKLLRNKIGFGSIQVYYEDKNPNKILEYKQVMKEDYIKKILIEPRHALDTIKNNNNE